MIALYRPGSSALHRLSPALKLLALAAIALVVTLVPHTPVSLGVLAGGVVAGYLVAGLGLRVLGRQLLPLRWIVVFMVVTQLIFLTPWAMVLNTSRVVLLVALAALVTLTTRTEDLLATVERALRPLRRLGVDAERVALTLSLTLSMVPVIADFARQIREAQHARGVRLGLRGVVPLLVVSLRHADDLADAMTARGID